MDIQLDSACRLSDYQCKNQDVIELRRKDHPITLAVNIYSDEVRQYEVNASHPVYEIVKIIGKELGLENTKELSLALPSASEKAGISISSLNWLDVTRSLNSQGVEDGDMVLLRKKFFIFNEDVREAEKNDLLRRMIYNQLQTELAHAKTERKKKVSDAASFTNSSSSSDPESTSDTEGAVHSPDLLSSVIQAFESSERSAEYSGSDFSLSGSPNKKSSNSTGTKDSTRRERSSSLSADDTTQKSLQKTLSRHQHHVSANFPVTLPSDNESVYLCFQSSNMYLSTVPQVSDGGPTMLKKWSINSLINWERIDSGMKLMFSDEWHMIFSDELPQISHYLSHMKSIVSGKDAESEAKIVHAQIDTEDLLNSTSSTPGSSPMKKKTPSVTLSLVSIHSSVHSADSGEDEGLEDAGIGGEEGATGISYSPAHEIEVFSPSHKPTKRKTSISPPSYFGKGFKDLVENYVLIHVNVLDQEIRQILVNVNDPVRHTIREICATFDIQYPEEHYLRVPRTVEETIKSYGGKPKVSSRGFFSKRQDAVKQPNIVLNDDVPLVDQIDWNMRPYVFVLKRIGKDEVDAAEKYSLEIGEEWPDGEDSDVARYRMFYQSWIGFIQGDYPIIKSVAIRLAGLLAYIYHGSKSSSPFWPPYDYDIKAFLPEKYHDSFGIESDVLKAHQQNEGLDQNTAIDTVIELCRNLPSSNGLYFEIKVPASGTLRKKMERRMFGLRRDGLICFGKGLKTVCWNQQYSDISDWAISNSSFHLKFGNKGVGDLYGFSYQARQIMELMQTYAKMHYKTAKEKKGPSISDV
ncbi:PREDICTED: uncharacterized protein LOC109580678 isoform X2 [Amphimedon queenslandica]|nr:PREDICTED: uncharacterized protein LOC109580678 isoform X2 [Amphimedon queenslandica]|eukprot:XP_019849675.1 PREDICTED: uncharacterized protein LOC109580678 isoform X2 [Amphimedon queenslandica]